MDKHPAKRLKRSKLNTPNGQKIAENFKLYYTWTQMTQTMSSNVSSVKFEYIDVVDTTRAPINNNNNNHIETHTILTYGNPRTLSTSNHTQVKGETLHLLA